MNEVRVRPALFRWACERSGMASEELRKRFSEHAAWGTGTVLPTLKQLEQFPMVAATHLRHALGFDREQQLRWATWTAALRRFVERADASGILVMVSGVFGSNNHRRLAPASSAASRCRIRSLRWSSSTAQVPLMRRSSPWRMKLPISAWESPACRTEVPERFPITQPNAGASELRPSCSHRSDGPSAVAQATGEAWARALATDWRGWWSQACWRDRTSYTEAYRLLGISKLSTFDRLAARLVQR